MSSVPGGHHHHEPPFWLDVLRDLLKLLSGWRHEAIRNALRHIEMDGTVRRPDPRLADHLRTIEQHPDLNNDQQHAVARAGAIVRGDVP